MQEDEFSLTKEQEAWVVYIMLAVTLVKLLLVVYCRSFTNEIIKAYAQDHLFDVITNVIGLVAALVANHVKDWIDPVGAIIVSISTIIPFVTKKKTITSFLQAYFVTGLGSQPACYEFLFDDQLSKVALFIFTIITATTCRPRV